MNLRELFRSADNVLEGTGNKTDNIGKQQDKASTCECPSCKSMISRRRVREQDYMCPACQYYFHVSARKRIQMYADPDSFEEFYENWESQNLLAFPEYDEKLAQAQQKSGEKEGVLCGRITIDKNPCCIFSMESNFMMGSMGTVVGDKITTLFEYAEKEGLPVIGITVSGGARMQEGMLSLMQMAKVSGAVRRHSEKGLLYVVLLTNPTTGGVEASFAMQADIILAEPNALIGFAGPRVIQQTLKKKLPKGFQRSEALLSCGFVDEIVTRMEQRDYLKRLLIIHGGRECNDRI